MFGTNGDIGTPGAVNENCFGYSLSRTPVDFEDISSTGTHLWAFGSSMDEQIAYLNLASAPFTYFGTPHSIMTVSSNGWLTAEDVEFSSWLTNKTKPGAANGRPFTGTIAPFWDDLVNTPASDSNLYFGRVPAVGDRVGHWIVQWQHFMRKGNPTDDLTFQAKFFDNGTIEFHFATMQGVTPGISATTWLERPAGDLALPVGTNSDFMSSNVAWRFTPNTPVTP
jgi:hypothetical protein